MPCFMRGEFSMSTEIRENELILAVDKYISKKSPKANNSISTSIVDNYSQPATRRVDWKVSIAYGDDFDVARKEILAMLTADKRVLNDPAPMVVIAELGNSAVVLSVRAWAANADYWDLLWDINERIYKELPQKGIHFAYPQMDVHIKQN